MKNVRNVRLAGRIRHSSVNGSGVRYVLFFQGCPHRCEGCQNPETWNPLSGEIMPISDIVDDIVHTRYIDGVTLSGGDPLFQANAAIEIIQGVRHARGNPGNNAEDPAPRWDSRSAPVPVHKSDSEDGTIRKFIRPKSSPNTSTGTDTARDTGDMAQDRHSRRTPSDFTFWVYTGWTYEEILDGKAGAAARELLGYADVLVDGPYISALRSEDTLYRGSSNQRLIDLRNLRNL